VTLNELMAVTLPFAKCGRLGANYVKTVELDPS